MELGDYIRTIRRYWVAVTALMVLGLMGGALLALLTPPTYTSKSQLFVSIQSAGSVTELQQGNSFSQARVQSYVKTATTPEVLKPAIESLGLILSSAELAPRVAVSADPNTVLISIAVEDTSPAQAASIAQAVSESLITAVDRLEKPAQGGDSPVRLSIVTPADAPSSPSGPNVMLSVLSGLFLGATVGVLWALFRTRFDTKIRGYADIANVSTAPVLGAIAYDNDAAKKPLLTQTGQQSPRAESFRQIRTNLQFANVSSTSKTMLVTSSLPGEGKTTTATNMAIAMAQAGQRVALVDADLRRPMTASYLGLERGAGLTTALVGAADIDDLLQPWGDDDLFVLTSGQIPPNPSELLGSEGMTQLIKRLEDAFDVVIIDAPPLIPVTDATVLSQKVGGVVLVVGSAKVRAQDVQKSLTSLELVNAQVLGVVLNLLPSKGPDAYAYAYYSYDSKPEMDARKTSPTKVLSGSHMKSSRRSRRAESDLSTLVSESR